MSSFHGTIEDVDRFLMPRIRNRVQTLARPYKDRERGVCQCCGKENGTLEAAHVHGRDRKAIVREVLEKYRVGSEYGIDDLDAFEREVVEAHEPVSETFLFLCRDCHREYDSSAPRPYTSAATSAPSERVACTDDGRVRDGDALPITLMPPDQDDFKQAFIESGIAEIREFYRDGRCVLPTTCFLLPSASARRRRILQAAPCGSCSRFSA